MLTRPPTATNSPATSHGLTPSLRRAVSHAVAITLYHLAALVDGRADANLPSGNNGAAKPTTRHNLEPSETKLPAASREAVASLFEYWLETLARFQYFRRTERERFAPNLQRLFNRFDLAEHDVQMLRGMLAQFHLFAFGDRGLQRDESSAPAEPTSEST